MEFNQESNYIQILKPQSYLENKIKEYVNVQKTVSTACSQLRIQNNVLSNAISIGYISLLLPDFLLNQPKANIFIFE